MADMYQDIGTLVSTYWYVFAILGGFIFVAYILFKSSSSKTPKPVQRSVVERQNFLDRMKFNKSDTYKKIEVNGKYRYQIEKIQASTHEGEQVLEMVLKPLVFGLLAIGKEDGYVFKGVNFTYDTGKPSVLTMGLGVTAWKREGLYYDNTLNKKQIEYFSREYSAQTDMETLSSEYYAMGQENSVIDPTRAHATLSEHLNIERIKEERKKQQLGS